MDVANGSVYSLSDGRSLYIRPEAQEKMFKYKQMRRTDKEAGGILIGRILKENNHFIIDDVTEPMPRDKRTRTRFSRNPEGHQEYMDEVFRRENGHCFYLGEWHTHPQKVPIPSSTDLKDWLRLLRIGYESDCLFFVILGTVELNVWCGNEKEALIKLKNEH